MLIQTNITRGDKKREMMIVVYTCKGLPWRMSLLGAYCS